MMLGKYKVSEYDAENPQEFTRGGIEAHDSAMHSFTGAHAADAHAAEIGDFVAKVSVRFPELAADARNLLRLMCIAIPS